MGGQPGTFTNGLSLISLCIGVAPVGFGFAFCTQPKEAQEPQAITAMASAAVSFNIFVNESPLTMQ